MKQALFGSSAAFILAGAWLLGLQPTSVFAQEAPAAGKKSSGPQVRMVCIKSLAEEEITLASKNDEGEWVEHGSTKLRDSLITPWVPVAGGVTHLVRKEESGFMSLGSFKTGGEDKRSIVVLLPQPDQKSYRTNVIDPAKLGFRKGTALITNFSRVPATVMLGKKRTEVRPGKQVAARVVAGDDGMYRMLVGYQGENKKLVACYDRYLQLIPKQNNFWIHLGFGRFRHGWTNSEAGLSGSGSGH